MQFFNRYFYGHDLRKYPFCQSWLFIVILIFAASACTDPREIESLEQQLASAQSHIRKDAATKLIRHGSAAIPSLLQDLHLDPIRDRYIKVQILGEIGDKRAIAPLLALVQADSENVHVRSEAATALGKFRDQSVAPVLSQLLLAEEITNIREAAAWSLGNLRDTTLVAFLVPGLSDSVSSVRRATLQALDRNWTTASEQAVDSVLSDPDETVRYIAVQLLGKHQSTNSLNRLISMLAATSTWVRSETATSLSQLADTAAVGPLIDRLQQSEGSEFESIQQALLELTGIHYALDEESRGPSKQ